MKNRIVFGLLMIAVVVGLFYLDWRLQDAGQRRFEKRAGEYKEQGKGSSPSPPVHGLPLALTVLVLTAMAFYELARLTAACGVAIWPLSGMTGTGMLATLPFWWQFVSPLPPEGSHVLLAADLILLAVFAEQMVRGRTADALRRVAGTLLAVVYLGAGGAIMLAMRVYAGISLLVLFLAAVKVCDIGAMFTGKAIGRHKMIPWLSPGKSWEGLAGGVAAAAGVSVAVSAALRIEALTLAQAAVFGVVVALAGQIGDLCESLLKRSAGAKDSGALVPEFGGVLDLLDSPLLAAPIAYLVLAAFRAV